MSIPTRLAYQVGSPSAWDRSRSRCRLTIEHVLHELGTGMSYEELLENYPTLKLEHIQAGMLYAAAVVAMDESIYQ